MAWGRSPWPRSRRVAMATGPEEESHGPTHAEGCREFESVRPLVHWFRRGLIRRVQGRPPLVRARSTRLGPGPPGRDRLGQTKPGTRPSRARVAPGHANGRHALAESLDGS